MKGDDTIHYLVGFGKYGTIGMDFAVSVVLGLLAGRWLDGKYHTSPWFALGGMALGVAVGFNILYKTVKQLQQESQRERERERFDPGRDDHPEHERDDDQNDSTDGA